MPVKVFKPTSPGRRDMTGFSFEEITRTEPERSPVSYTHLDVYKRQEDYSKATVIPITKKIPALNVVTDEINLFINSLQ